MGTQQLQYFLAMLTTQRKVVTSPHNQALGTCHFYIWRYSIFYRAPVHRCISRGASLWSPLSKQGSGVIFATRCQLKQDIGTAFFIRAAICELYRFEPMGLVEAAGTCIGLEGI